MSLVANKHVGNKRIDDNLFTFIRLKESYLLYAGDSDWYSEDQSAAIQILQKFDSGNYQKKAQVYMQSFNR